MTKKQNDDQVDEKKDPFESTGPMSDEQRERFEADAARITEQNTKAPDAGLES